MRMASWAAEQSTFEVIEDRLLSVWDSHAVNESYRNIMLQYFDRLPSTLQRQAIDAQLKASFGRTGPYFRIQEQLSQRNQHQSSLKRLIQNEQINLHEICDRLHEIRTTTLTIYEQFEEFINKTGFQYDPLQPIGTYYFRVFKSFQLDYLKETCLRFYIRFGEGYDPLLISHFRSGKKQNDYVQHKDVTELFNISMTYYYRLLRAHQSMLELASRAETKEDNKEKPVMRKMVEIEEEPCQSDSFSRPITPVKRINNSYIRISTEGSQTIPKSGRNNLRQSRIHRGSMMQSSGKSRYQSEMGSKTSTPLKKLTLPSISKGNEEQDTQTLLEKLVARLKLERSSLPTVHEKTKPNMQQGKLCLFAGQQKDWDRSSCACIKKRVLDRVNRKFGGRNKQQGSLRVSKLLESTIESAVEHI